MFITLLIRVDVMNYLSIGLRLAAAAAGALLIAHGVQLSPLDAIGGNGYMPPIS